MFRALKFRKNNVRHSSFYSTKVAENNQPGATAQSFQPPASKPAVDRKNIFGIPLISESLEKFIFGDEPREKEKRDSAQLEKALVQLRSFGIRINNGTSSSASADKLSIQLPHLHGNVESHFFKIGSNYIEPYIKLANEYMSVKKMLPKIPGKWEFRSGWTRYDPVTGSTSSVPCPLEDVFCFDVETCVKEGSHPVMAAALTSKAWYSWCSEDLINPDKKFDGHVVQSELIPLRLPDSNGNPRLVIGHNVCYDRARTSEEYNIEPTGTRFLDTMSLHIVVNGMTSGQRMRKQMKVDTDSFALVDEEIVKPKWLDETSLNNLSDVYQLYCQKGPLFKQKRDVFVVGSMQEIRDDFQSLMNYCSNDVSATYDVFAHVFPLFRSRCPHPVTLAGMLEMGSAFLPINSVNWNHYIRQADFAANELEEEVERILAQQANENCQLLIEEKYKEDLWMWDQEWKCSELKMKKLTKKLTPIYSEDPTDLDSPSTDVTAKNLELKDLEQKFERVMETSTLMYKNQPKVPGYPGWYSDICERDSDGFSAPTDLGLSKSVIPKLLRLSWMGYPLHRHKEEKWGFLEPKGNDNNMDLEDMWSDDDGAVFPLKFLKMHLAAKGNFRNQSDTSNLENKFVQEPTDSSAFKTNKFKQKEKKETTNVIELPEAPGCRFIRLPHKDGKELRVGNPLSKSFFGKVRDGVLSTESGHLAEKVLQAGKMLSYWKSNRERVCGQTVVSTSDHAAVIPQLVSAGTLTRRAVERTWLTASNAKPDRVGSELKCMVQAPPGYHLVGADVDSQELWIAAVFGDSHFVGEHGCTALGWMTLQGSKSAGTDMHSVTAKSVGVSRDEAKILNYGRIYGAGVPFAKQLLQSFNPALTDIEASRLATKMYTETKGERTYMLNKTGALCYALLTHSFENPTDLIGSVVTRKEMNQLLNIKLKLDAYLEAAVMEKNEAPKFYLNEIGYSIASEMGLFSSADVLSLNDLSNFITSVGKITSRDRAENWKEEINSLSSKSIWTGGTESHTFNRLEDIALDWNAKTPVLGCQISRVLESEMVGTDFLPSRINWVVQSSAVDYLHLLLVSMKMLTDTYDIDARFVISIHDEVRYLVKSEDRYRAGLALQISNLLVRAMFCRRIGMKSLPKDVAFFSGVDIDKVMRKEPSSDCKTPSNPQGLTQGYGIPLGECLTIHDLIKKTGGSLLK